MNHSFLVLLLLASVALLMPSCNGSEPTALDDMLPTEKALDEVKLIYGEFGANSHDVVNYFKLMKPNDKVKYVSPMSRDGKLQAYYVKFEKGWAIISADKHHYPVLASSDNGSLDLNDAESPVLKIIWAEFDQMNAKLCGNDCKSPEWAFIDQEYSAKETESSRRAPRKVLRGIGDGKWIASDTTTYINTTAQDHVITTTWTQSAPYNAFAQYYTYQIGEHCPVGCIPLAVGQILCHYRENKTNNTAIPNSAHMPNANYQSFVVDSWSTASWPQLRSNSNYAALFLAQLGSVMHTTYGQFSSGTSVNEIEPCLNLYHVGCSTSTSFSHTFVKSKLMSGKPIIMTAYNSTNGNAHAYIVDACSESKTYFRVHYVWDPDYVPTDDELAINPT